MVSFDGGSASKVDDVTALPSRQKMADMCYYGNVMTTTRWWLCVTILHLQQYSHRLNLFFVVFWRYLYRVFQKELYKASLQGPDFTPLDFFLWGFFKDQVFLPPLPANVVELRTRITAAVAKVTPEMLRSVRQETDYRWEVCRITNGSHIEP